MTVEVIRINVRDHEEDSQYSKLAGIIGDIVARDKLKPEQIDEKITGWFERTYPEVDLSEEASTKIDCNLRKIFMNTAMDWDEFCLALDVLGYKDITLLV